MSGRTEKDKQKAIQEKHQAILCELLKLDDNKYCVDCDAKGPRWASWNLGVFLCIRCAGIHRNLGVHVSKVKSVNLDSWTPEQLAMVQQIGNRRARSVYEAGLPANFRRPQTDSALEALIRAKYEQKKYVDKDWIPPQLSAVLTSDGVHKERRRSKSSLGEHLNQESRSLSHIKNASDSRLSSISSSMKSVARRDSSEPRSSTLTNTPCSSLAAATAASRRHRDASPAATANTQHTSNDELPPVELISLASPEPDAKSSLTDFGNFVGVESVTATSMPTLPTSSAADLAGVDDSVAATTANKQATKDDIMALYGTAINSSVYNTPGGMYMAHAPMVAPQAMMQPNTQAMMQPNTAMLPNAGPMMMPAVNATMCPVPPMSYGMYTNYQPQMMPGYQGVPVDVWSSQQPPRQPQPPPAPQQLSAGYTMSNQLWQ